MLLQGGEEMNWEEVRVNAAIAAMQTLVRLYNHNAAARIAVEYADGLVKELRSQSAPTDDEH
jgi:hypothetical protein